MSRRHTTVLRLAALALVAQGASVPSASALVDGGTLRLVTFDGWQAFEVITEGDDPAGDGAAHAMPDRFDGTGARLVDAVTLRVLVNHESGDASISEVDLDLAALQIAVANVIGTGDTGGVAFVLGARQAYDRWSADGGASWTDTSSTATTSFQRFCSGQSYASDTFGPGRGFVDPLFITGEEVAGGRLFVLDGVQRDLYQLSGVAGGAPGGLIGVPSDAWENAALIDTGETGHVALLLSPDGGSQTMKLYVGEKGRDTSGAASTSFLARNGLAYGNWYFLLGSYPALGATNGGGFGTIPLGILASDKIEDVDTSPSDPTQVVMGDQTSGVFRFDFDLVFGPGFDAGASGFTLTKIADTIAGAGSLDSPDNVDWTAPTTLAGVPFPEGLLFVNEDNATGEVWRMLPDGAGQVRIAGTTTGAESTGILDVSALLGYRPGSVALTNNQGTPSSMSVLVAPDATPDPGPSAWSDQGCALAGASGDPLLVGSGPLSAGSLNSVDLSLAAPAATAGLFLAFASTPVPFKGGTLKPVPFLPPVFVSTGAGGAIGVPFVMPAGVPGGTGIWVQWAILDAAAIHGVALSNAILGVTP